MKIQEKISHLSNETALLVVMGSHHGIIYKIANQEIHKKDEIRIDTPVYSDNEGMFKRGSGDNFGFGSVLEPKKDKAQKDFSKEFGQKIKDILTQEKLERIYLFAPAEMKSFIEDDWIAPVKNAVVMRFEGNFVSEPPAFFAEMIQNKADEGNKKREPTGEAKQILGKIDKK